MLIYLVNKHITRKMVPITGRASASFSSMLKLKHIGNEQHGCHWFNRQKKTLGMRVGCT